MNANRQKGENTMFLVLREWVRWCKFGSIYPGVNVYKRVLSGIYEREKGANNFFNYKKTSYLL